jgi:O-antigen/teichoic acid export membrane protein
MLHHVHRFRRWAGVDRAVFFSNAAQLTRLFTGPVTMALVLRYLTPEVQGYFYAFAGVVAMQVFLEMGFSQNILQFTSHEYAKLQFTAAGTLEGDPVSRSRLISLGRLAFGYYAVAAAIFLVAVGIGGHIFFTVAVHRDPAGHIVVWQGAWWIIAVTAALSLAVNPAWSLLQGCNQVAVLAKFNFWVALATFGANAVALISGAGIYASAIGAAFNLLLSLAYLLWRWRAFFMQFREHPRHGHVSWKYEIWPFQWRIAVSWMSGYFVFDIVNPIAFYFCGPVDAGRLGMSLQLVRIISNVALTWISTKGPQFGMLIATRAWNELDALWRRSTIQVFVFYLLGYAAFLSVIPFVGYFLPKVPARIAPFPVNAWLGGALVTQVLIGAMAMELRAHKREPFMWLSVANAVLSVAFMLPLVKVWGIAGEAMGYALALWAIFLPGCRIYQVKRLEYRRHAEDSAGQPSTVILSHPETGEFS